MQAGQTIPEEIVAKKKLFEPKPVEKLKALIVKIENKTQFVIEKEFSREEFTYEAFAAQFPKDQGRLAQILVTYLDEDGINKFKHVTILWCPDNAKSLQKMPYSLAKTAFSDTFQSDVTLQLSSSDQLTEEYLVKAASKKK